MARRSRLRHAFVVVLANLGILVAGLVVIELLFGNWFARDPLDGLNIQRDQAVVVDAGALYQGGRKFTYRRDHWGFRGDGIEPSRIDILTIGGSTTNQLYLPEDETWQSVMQQALARQGVTVTVANAGVDGQSTVGHIFNFDGWFRHVPGLKPKLVLAYVGVNDASLGGNVTDTLTFSSRYKWIRHNSALFRLGRTVQGMMQARGGRLTHERLDFAGAQWTAEPSLAGDTAGDAAAYAGRLKTLVARIRAMGAQPVLVTQLRGDSRRSGSGAVIGMAAAEGMNGVDHWRRLAALNGATLEVCAEEQIACLDVAGHLSFGDGDFYDRVHNTPQGARKLGLWLAEGVLPLAR